MEIGYLLGCLFSMLFWKVDKMKIYGGLTQKLNSILKNIWIVKVLYIIIFIGIILLLEKIKYKEAYDFVTAVLVIDISNAEYKNLHHEKKINFSESISLLSKAMLCGFVAPLFYILILGNLGGLVFTFLYFLSSNEELEWLQRSLFVVPCFLLQLFVYLLYVCRSKKMDIDFDGEYFKNSFLNPLLNIDILGAHIIDIKFYYYGRRGTHDYMKSYGKSNAALGEKSVKEYVGIQYIICTLTLLLFIVILIYKRT